MREINDLKILKIEASEFAQLTPHGLKTFLASEHNYHVFKTSSYFYGLFELKWSVEEILSCV